MNAPRKKIRTWLGMASVILALTGSIPLLAQSAPYHETVYATPQSVLKKWFNPNNELIRKTLTLTAAQKESIEKKLGWQLSETSYTYFEGSKNGTDKVAFIIDELGKHYPMTLLISVNKASKSTVDSLALLVYREQIGSEVRKKRFLRQFINKSLDNPIAVDNDITGITGATVSSWSVAAATRKALALSSQLIQHSELAGVN